VRAAALAPPSERAHPARAPTRAPAPRPDEPTALAFATSDGRPLQRRIEVGSADDPLEREADRTADRVLRRCSCGGVPGPDGECAACKAKRLSLSRATPGPASAPAPPIVSQVLAAPGRPLDARSRSYFEPRFGADLSAVRVHDDATAAESAGAVNAHAYAVGSDIVFAAGRHAPGTPSGNRLLAHELAHVLQQDGGGPGVSETEGGGRSLRRKCGTDVRAGPADCTPRTELPAGEVFYYEVSCDDLKPGQLEHLRTFVSTLPAGTVVDVHGHASVEGPVDFNQTLSCARAVKMTELLKTEAPGVTVGHVFSHGPTATPGTSSSEQAFYWRNVTIEVKSKPAPKEKPAPPAPTPAAVAAAMADEDCKRISALFAARALTSVGLFLQIYTCLTCAFAAAIRAGKFKDPLWIARVNRFTLDRLFAAFGTPRPGYYTSAFAPCDLLDDCLKPSLGTLERMGCAQIMQGTGPLAYLQLCTENIGGVHLGVDLRDALKSIGCSTADNKYDYAQVVPLFQSCNIATLTKEFPVVGGVIASKIAIPKITEQRDAAWKSAGCP